MLFKASQVQKIPMEDWESQPIYPDVNSLPQPSLFSRIIKHSINLAIISLLLVIIILIYIYLPSSCQYLPVEPIVPTEVSSLDSLETQIYEQPFEKYLKSFNKTYSEHEKSIRFKIYVKRMEENKYRNAENGGAQFGETIFSDWTENEIRNSLIPEEVFFSQFKSLATEPAPTLSENFTRPGLVDWRKTGKIARIKDQGPCGSCWAFGTVAAVEAQVAIYRRKNIELSEQQLVDCDTHSFGCNGGNLVSPAIYAIQSGLHSEQDYPYLASDHHTCRVFSGELYKIDNAYVIENNEGGAADWVALQGPVTIGMAVLDSMFHYSSGVYDPSSVDCNDRSKIKGGHAMAIVGYGNEGGKDYWLVKNSWGTRWGIDGYMKLRRGVNSCHVGELIVAPYIAH